tara:strand:- start:2456 stop:3289 length:834 start_codon:yes stop_codon:yes gene_type:complete
MMVLGVRTYNIIILDSLLLTLVLVPIFYYIFYLPLKTHSDKCLLAEKELLDYKNNLEQRVKERTSEVENIQNITFDFITSLIEYRDFSTGRHIIRTKEYIKELALSLRFHPKFKELLTLEYIQNLYNAAPLHDIGKIAIPDYILLKNKKLNKKEIEIIKRHVDVGGEVISSIEQKLIGNDFLKLAFEMARYHHEKWDGSGYTIGLKGNSIPVSARLMSIVDVYDAITDKRVYKKRISHKKALELIKLEKGISFAPDIVDTFIRIEKKVEAIMEKYKD